MHCCSTNGAHFGSATSISTAIGPGVGPRFAQIRGEAKGPGMNSEVSQEDAQFEDYNFTAAAGNLEHWGGQSSNKEALPSCMEGPFMCTEAAGARDVWAWVPRQQHIKENKSERSTLNEGETWQEVCAGI